MVSIQNEIGMRYRFAIFEANKGQDRVTLQDALGFPSLECQMSYNIAAGMNLGNKCLPPLMCHHLDY